MSATMFCWLKAESLIVGFLEELCKIGNSPFRSAIHAACCRWHAKDTEASRVWTFWETVTAIGGWPD